MSDAPPILARARHSESEELYEIVAEGRRLVARAVAGDGSTFVGELAPTVGDRSVAGPWRHFKGRVYEFVSLVDAADGGPALLLYRDSDAGVWVRPWAMVEELVERDGYRGPRFMRDDTGG